LGDGFRVEVKVVVWESKDALTVPGSALFRAGEDWNAFVVEGGRARARRVEVGRRTPTLAEVREGLREGDRVILYPGDQVRDGLRVE
jgi:HlyD family secretion protein